MPLAGEDIRHLQNRFDEHRCHAILGDMRGTEPCETHMCRWIRDGAARFDAQQVIGVAQPSQQQRSAEVLGMDALREAAQLPPEVSWGK